MISPFPVVDRGGRIAGSVWLSTDLGSLDAALANRRNGLALQTAALALALALLVTALLGRTIVRPLGRIGQATREISEGRLDTRLQWGRSDEIGTLARDFDRMADDLEHSHGHFETEALTDPLTGLLNHRAFHDRLETDLSRAARERYSVTVIAFDLDSFKDINDSFGHGGRGRRDAAKRGRGGRGKPPGRRRVRASGRRRVRDRALARG